MPGQIGIMVAKTLDFLVQPPIQGQIGSYGNRKNNNTKCVDFVRANQKFDAHVANYSQSPKAKVAIELAYDIF